MKKLTLVLAVIGLAGCCDCPEPIDYTPILKDIRAQQADIHRLSTLILGQLQEE